MPPKAKYTKKEIIVAALEMARDDGIDSLTARALGQKLGTSSRPIFTAFQNMEEVQQEVIKAARNLYNQYVEKGLSQIPAFKGVGTQYICFAKQEPKLFQLLFMSEQTEMTNISGVLALIDDNYKDILSSIETMYKVKNATAQKLYHHLWIYTHGIASLCATKVCDFDGEKIDEMLTEVFVSLLQKAKAVENG